MSAQSVINASLVEEEPDMRIWSPEDKPDLFWIEYLDSNPALARAAMDAFIFQQIGKPGTWETLPLNPALISIRNDWLDRRWNHLVYSHLAVKHGLPVSFKGLVGGNGQPLAISDLKKLESPVLIETNRAAIEKPEPVTMESEEIYFYPHPRKTDRLLPVAVFVHFGMPPGAVPPEKLLHGPDSWPEPGKFLTVPAQEMVTTGERNSRPVGLQEALLITGLPPGQMEELMELAWDTALFTYSLWAQHGLELWSLRLEFVQTKWGISLYGSISACALSYKGVFLPPAGESGYVSSVWAKPELKKGSQARLKELKRKIELELANRLCGDDTFECENSLDQSVDELSALSA